MENVEVCAVDDIPKGESRAFEVAIGLSVLVAHLDDGTWHAIENVCTHDWNPLDEGELKDGCIECPRHGAKFDVKTGEATQLPAYRPVDTYPVKIEDGKVIVTA